MDTMNGLAFLIAALAITVGVFLAFREVVLWYFRLNQIADNLAIIARQLQQPSQQSGGAIAPTQLPPAAPTPPRNPLTGISANPRP